MSGGTYEYVAAYVNNEHQNLKNGLSLVNGAAYTKDVYTKGSEDDGETNYNANSSKYGDAVYETSSGSSGSWYRDYSYIPYLRSPFFVRGGGYYNGTVAGLFHFGYEEGNAIGDHGFRPVLIVL